MATAVAKHLTTSLPGTLEPMVEKIDGDPVGKHLLTLRQMEEQDIHDYIAEAEALEKLFVDPKQRGVDQLRFIGIKVLMRQPSTRTGGSFIRAAHKVGASAEMISDFSMTSEAKGETISDGYEAFATQADLIVIRDKDNGGPEQAALAIDRAVKRGKLPIRVPVINAGDGTNEHPTQVLGDVYTIYKHFGRFRGLNLVIVGDHERYRIFHSLILAATTLGMHVTAVQCDAAKVPPALVKELADEIEITSDLDAAIKGADVLYLGRNPDEYDGDDPAEQARSKELAATYKNWIVTADRVRPAKKDLIIMHPRPRRSELSTDLDDDPRTVDIEQMANMIPMRAAILTRHLGKPVLAN